MLQAVGIGRLTDGVFVERQCMLAGRHVAAARMVEWPLHRLELLVDVELLPRFEHQHFHAVRGEHMRGHPAGSARADDDRIVDAL